MHSYYTLPNDKATDLLNALRDGQQPDAEAYSEKSGTGTILELDGLDELAEDLLKMLADSSPAAFEAEATATVHNALPLPAVIAGDNGFWRWLSFCPAQGAFTEVIKQRFHKQGLQSHPVNFAIGSNSTMRDGLLARLWWRGRCLHESTAADPYTWARRGDIDTWASHIIDQEFGACPNAAKALLYYQFPNEKQTKDGTMTPIKKYRELPKLMRAMHATHSFESMSFEQCLALVKDLAKELDESFAAS